MSESAGQTPPSAQGKVALFPGTFDPMTNGHLDVIQRGRHMFDRLMVGVGHNPAKREIFTQHERVEMIRELVNDGAGGNVEVRQFTGLTVDFARQVEANAILRGLRNVTDLAFEFQLALTNRALSEIETVFIMTGEQYAFTSSTLIKQIASGGAVDRLNRLLPPLVVQRLQQKKDEMGGTLPWAHVDHFTQDG